MSDDLRRTMALACRILAARGLSADILGHVSVRADGEHLFVRCRGPEERGLLFTTPDDIRLVAMSGAGAVGGGYSAPNGFPIHTGLLRARPDVDAVVHAHPPNVVAADLAGVPLVPMVGAHDIPAARMAEAGIPVFERAVLISTPELAGDMVAAMGDRPVCILRGHGVTTVGATVEQAVVAALALDALAAMALRVAAAGTTPTAISPDDLASLPDLGTGFNDALLWRHHVARLEHDGFGLP